MDDLFSSLASFVKENKLVALLIVAGVMFFGYGLITSLISSNSSSSASSEADPSASSGQDVFFSKGSESEVNQDTKVKSLVEIADLAVDIEGAVAKPGVHTLKQGQRVADALLVAGDLLPEANNDWFSKNINKAQKLSDGMKIYVPYASESGMLGTTDQIVSGSQAGTGLININSASSSQLDSLPGIGEVTSGKIIGGRPYTQISELLGKKIVGQKVYDQIKDLIVAP